MIQLTPNARNAASNITLTPVIVFRIPAYNKIFGNANISEYVRIGDPGLLIGNDWRIGGVRLIQGNNPYVSYSAGGGTTASIGQKIDPARKQSTSVTQMVVTLIDKNEEVSALISPGIEVDELLGQECEISIGFAETSFPEDYNIVFRGLISDIESGAGFVNFMLLSSEDKKRRPLISKQTDSLNGALGAGAITTIDVVDSSIFTTKVLGPDGLYDSTIERLVRVEDELFKYDGITGNQLQNVTRAYLGTTAVAHANGKDVTSGIRLTGNGIDLALKIMLSGVNDYYATGVDIRHINRYSVTEPLDQGIFFNNINIVEQYGVTAGDYITTVGSIHGANNITLVQISDVQVTDDGSYVIIDSAAFVDDINSLGTASFRSKYDTLGIGLKMKPTDVDVTQHEFIRDFFLSNFTYDFQFLSDVTITKEFLDQEIYAPMACFAVPRQGRSSVTYTIGPIGGNSIPVLNLNNVKNAPSLRVKRSTASNFFNEVQYQYDYNTITEKFAKGVKFESPESKTRIDIGNKPIVFQSKGIYTANNASQITTLASERWLGRYRYGAEFITNVMMLYGEGYPIEIGDIVLVDYGDLKLTDFNTGDRSGGFKYMEVMNKTLNNKTGDVALDLVNTSFELTDRYGTIAPASKIGSGATNVRLPIKKSFGTKPFQQETYKWADYVGETILVHDANWTVQEETTLKVLSTNPSVIICDPPLSFTPTEDYIIDIPYYPDSTDASINVVWKGMHAFFSPVVDVVSSPDNANVVVAPGDIDKFRVGAIIRINNFDFSDYSEEAEVTAVDTGTNTVTFDPATLFTIDSTHELKLVGFLDGGYSYRLI